jgi:tetratricopeptide (TPR) repeat protein
MVRGFSWWILRRNQPDRNRNLKEEQVSRVLSLKQTAIVTFALCYFTLFSHLMHLTVSTAYAEDLKQLKSEFNQFLKQGKFSEAIFLGEKALKISQKMNGEKSEETAACYNNLGVAYHDTGDYRKAESTYQKALSIILEIRGKKYGSTGKYYYNLAALYFDMGDYGKAESLCQKALTIILEIYGENSSDTDDIYFNMASRYVKLGNYDKAEPLIKKCLKINKESIRTDLVKSNRYEVLGSLYRKMGRNDKAKQLEQEAQSLRNEHAAKTKLLETSPSLKKAENELNEAYQSCMAILNTEAQGRLKDRQEEWIKRRAKGLESDARGIKEVETSIFEDTKQRIAHLKALSSTPFQWMLKTSGSPDSRVNPVNLPKETLTVSFNPASSATVEAGSPINVSWTLNHAPVQPDKVYDFVILSIPNTVRLKGEGFMVLPPQQDLPFGLKYNPDRFRVVFPLYLLNQKKPGSFIVRPLVAGRFDIEWSYLALDRKTRQLVFSAEEPNRSASFEVLDATPKIIVQDRMGGDTPKDIRVSYSGAYELKTYENYFEIYQAATGRLILQEAGTIPEFSSTSRFLVYYSSNGLVVLDLLNTEPISFPEGITFSTVDIAWARGDSSMILGGSAYGTINLLNPYLDSQKGITTRGAVCQCAACSAWGNGLVFDRETSLVNIACNGVDEGPGLCDSLLGDLSAEVLGYDSCEAWTSYLNQLGLQMPSAPQRGWTFPGGLWFSHGISEEPGTQLDPEDKVLLKSLLRPPKKASFSEGLSEGIASSTSKVTYTSNPDVVEEALANRLKEKGLNFPKNLPMNKTTGNMEGSANRVLDKVFPKEDCFSRNITEYWQYTEAQGAPTLLRMSCGDGAAHTNVSGALVLMDNKGGWIDLAERLGEFLKSRSRELSSDPLELSYEAYYGGAPEVRIFLSANDILMICSIDAHYILLYDARQNRIISFITDVIEADGLQSLRLSQDGRFVLQINKGGRLFIYDVQKSKRILNGVYLDDEWVLYTDEGFYDATTEGGHFVSWYYPGLQEHFDFNQFESAFKRPELIKEILSGGSSELPSVKPTSPPRITLASHEPLIETTEKSYTLNASVSAPDSVTTVRIFVNGEPVKEMPIGGKTADVSAEVPLLSGLNRISAVAYNEKGFSSNLKYVDVVCTNAEVPKPDLYVLTVGISQYPKLPKEWQLSYAHTDASNLADAFKSQEGKLFRKVHTRTLANQDATPTSITEELTALEKSGKNDLVVIMLAGHGIRSKDGTFYFLTPTGDINAPETGDGALSWEMLGQYLEKIPGRVVLLLDACHSGGVTTETVVPNDDLAKKLFAKGKGGVTVLAASKGRQVSMESPDVGGGFGVFTYGIVQALSAKAAEADTDGNGFVEWLELVQNVSAFVHNETRGAQTPWVARSEIFGDFPVAIGERRLAKKAEIPVQLPPPYMGLEKEVTKKMEELPVRPSTPERPATKAFSAPAPASPSPTADSVGPIDAAIRSYYTAVQNKNIDQAINFYATAKRPKIKRGVLETIAKGTLAYRIEKIDPVEVGNGRAKVMVYLYQKKIDKSEDHWEIAMDLINEQGEWRIVSTPGKKIP